MITRKRLLILVGICIAALLLVVALALKERASNTSDAEDGFYVSNMSEYEPKLDKQGIGEDIHTALQTKITADEGKAPTKVHQGTIRNGSFTSTKNGAGVPYQTMLVDFPSLKRTYKITLLGGDQYDQSILYIVCPSDKELVYPAKDCRREP